VAQRIVIEYDGLLHFTNVRKRRHDQIVRDRLRQLGWEVIVLFADDVYARPLQTLWRIQDALRERGHPAVPPELDRGWPSSALKDASRLTRPGI